MQVGVHDKPLAKELVQPGPGAPFAIGPPALHVWAVHASGGPAMESVSSRRPKLASHAVALVNMSPEVVSEVVVQPVIS